MFKFSHEKKQKELDEHLREAICSDDVLEVESLLHNGADPNAPPSYLYRNRPLGLAIEWANAATVDALLQAGSDPLQPYHFAGKNICLSEAARWGKRPEAVIKLLENAEQKARNQKHLDSSSLSEPSP